MDIYGALKVVAEGSNQLVNWALAVAAGSVAAIVSTGYLRPKRSWRLIYLLFAPAWIFVAVSVYFGNQISRRYMAAVMTKKENLVEINNAINSDFTCQLFTLNIAFLFFAAWLAMFLCWWIFIDKSNS